MDTIVFKVSAITSVSTKPVHEAANARLLAEEGPVEPFLEERRNLLSEKKKYILKN